jgi:hypothetical protein
VLRTSVHRTGQLLHGFKGAPAWRKPCRRICSRYASVARRATAEVSNPAAESCWMLVICRTRLHACNRMEQTAYGSSSH